MANNIKELPAIYLNGIGKSYGSGENRVEALKNINLEIASGDFLALCGPSGSGKSTLLNILSGIDKPTTGTVMFLNQVLNELNEQQLAQIRSRELGFIFQFFNLMPVLNALDNVRYPLILNGHFSRKEAKMHAMHYLNLVGLGDLAERKPGELSGGQQQRVAIARALAHEPKIVVADEPTGNLDIATGESILDLLLDINAQTATTFIISTHSIQLKERAGRVINIRDGELVYDA
jgi:putative ABC transport system ATP-binding protein